MGENGLTFEHDRYLASWMRQRGVSLVVACDKTRILTLSSTSETSLNLSKHQASGVRDLAFGHALDGSSRYQTLWSSGRGEILKRVEFQVPPELRNGSLAQDCLALMPSKQHFLGRIKIGPLAIGSEGQLFFVKRDERSSSIGVIGSDDSPVENHLSVSVDGYPEITGLCLRDSRPRYVTLVSEEGGKGILYDLVESEVVSKDLDRPSDPCYSNGHVYFLERGSGHLARVEANQGRGTVERMSFFPGFLRGLALIDDSLIVATSLDRYESLFGGTPLGQRLRQEGVRDRCGIYIVNLENFSVVHYCYFGQEIKEITSLAIASHPAAIVLELIEPSTFQQSIPFSCYS
jgi:uncharacterized protein (TIGR03032 family)